MTHYRTHLATPLLLLILLFGGLVFGLSNLSRVPSDGQPSSAAAVTVRIQTRTTTVSYSQLVQLPVLAENTGSEPYHITFPSACTDPDLTIDGAPIDFGRICAQVLTEVSLRPGEERRMTLTFRVVPEGTDRYQGETLEIGLAPGPHTLAAEWGEFSSQPVTLNVAP